MLQFGHLELHFILGMFMNLDNFCVQDLILATKVKPSE